MKKVRCIGCLPTLANYGARAPSVTKSHPSRSRAPRFYWRAESRKRKLFAGERFRDSIGGGATFMPRISTERYGEALKIDPGKNRGKFWVREGEIYWDRFKVPTA